jgi:hypothetical protein
MKFEPPQTGFNPVPAMVAYWDSRQHCVFSNEAFLHSFGLTSAQMKGLAIKDVLGSTLYEQNLPHILGVLRGEKRIFKRQIPVISGQIRESIITYTPDIIYGNVCGFTAYCAEIMPLRAREAALEKAIRNQAGDKKEIRGSQSICSACQSVHDSEMTFAHGLCPKCSEKITAH